MEIRETESMVCAIASLRHWALPNRSLGGFCGTKLILSAIQERSPVVHLPSASWSDCVRANIINVLLKKLHSVTKHNDD